MRVPGTGDNSHYRPLFACVAVHDVVQTNAAGRRAEPGDLVAALERTDRAS